MTGRPVEKTLFIRRPGAFGGIEVLLLDWLSAIDYAKTDVVLGSSVDFISGQIARNGLPVEYRTLSLPVLGSYRSIYRSWHRDISGIAPDKVVIMEGMVDEIPLPAILAAHNVSRGNLYLTEHLAWPFPPKKTRSIHFGFIPGLGLWWYRTMWTMRRRGRLTKRVLAVSEAVKDVLLMYGYPEGKVAVAYHGVDVSRFAPSETARAVWRRANGIPDDAVVMVSTARLAREKRLERMVQGFAALAGAHPELWLLIAGDGPLRKELEDSAATVVGGDRIRFLGLVQDVPGLLQASDLFVLPSDREGLSVSLTEAMSTGLTCIITNVSGANEVIRDGENGLLVEPSPEGVLGGIARALRMGAAARGAIARNARNTIVEKFEKRKSLEHILSLLDIACAPHPQ